MGRDEKSRTTRLSDVRGRGHGDELQDRDKGDGGTVARDDEDTEDLVEGDVES